MIFIHRKIGNASLFDAEDLAQSTFLAVFEPTRRRWDPKAEPNIFYFRCSTAMSVIANWRRSRGRRHARPFDHEGIETLEEMGAVAVSVPTTEEALAARERAALAIARVEARIVKDSGCREIFALEQGGIEVAKNKCASSRRTSPT